MTGTSHHAQDSAAKTKKATQAAKKQLHGPGVFERVAHHVSHVMGRPIAFCLAFAIIMTWALSGPLFGFTDTWQLVINTGTTIITFLMVFIIQGSQNRDTMAVQIKLAELIIAAKGAKNTLATAEDMSEHELEEMHRTYCEMAEQTLHHLHSRKKKKK